MRRPACESVCGCVRVCHSPPSVCVCVYNRRQQAVQTLTALCAASHQPDSTNHQKSNGSTESGNELEGEGELEKSL